LNEGGRLGRLRSEKCQIGKITKVKSFYYGFKSMHEHRHQSIQIQSHFGQSRSEGQLVLYIKHKAGIKSNRIPFYLIRAYIKSRHLFFVALAKNMANIT